MGGAQLEYEEWPASASLCGRIAGYWRFCVRGDPGAMADHVIVPDGLVCLTALHRQGAWWAVMLMGPSTRAMTVPIHDGDCTIGIRIRPGHARALFGIDPAVLADAFLPGPERVDWARRVLGDPHTAGPHRLDRAAADLVCGRPAGDRLVADAAAMWMDGAGAIGVREMAGRLGIGERQLRRRFLLEAGISPKTFMRVRRQRAAWVTAVGTPNPPLTSVAMDGGFADQAHFIRDARTRFAEAPTAIQARLRQIRHRFAP